MFNESVGFAVGTGRCGTNFISKVLEQEKGVSSVHERHPLNDSFHRYSKWYKLPIDHEGFLRTKEAEIKHDLNNHYYSFEASPFLSLSTVELYARFNAKFIFLVRSPEKVVNSFLHKGWYLEEVLKAESGLPPSYQGNKKFHHFLARIMPMNEQFEKWKSLTRVGKLSWYWNAMNEQIAYDLSLLPENRWRMVKLETLNYESYVETAHFLNLEVEISKDQYDKLAHTRPNSRNNVLTINDWNHKEIEEFESEVYPMAKKLGYEYRVPFMKQTLLEKPSQCLQTSLKKPTLSIESLKRSSRKLFARKQ